MAEPRTLLLFDPKAQPPSWNERLIPGEFAVLYSSEPARPVSSAGTRPAGPTCTVFGSLSEAEAYASEQVAASPWLRCRIYDHHGLGGRPVREVRGTDFKGDSELSARFRRWAGGLLFFGGAALMGLDWSTGFTYNWPAALGARMLPVGLVLLLTELVIIITERRKKAAEQP
ncbi:hypothetical protein [Granulicella sp. WH15]|uniref:hypothetical protein n=1 Tax=Granulicella sp. WH15 TaxID=2602070 RepID=UPI00210378AF|nr:hypothetical protein [Granulicella sp. WH15]